MKHIKLFEDFYAGWDSLKKTDGKRNLTIFLDKPLKLERILKHKDGDTSDIMEVKIKEVEDNESSGPILLKIVDPKTDDIIGSIMYDKENDEFIEGQSSWHYVYEPKDERSEKILDLFKETCCK